MTQGQEAARLWRSASLKSLDQLADRYFAAHNDEAHSQGYYSGAAQGIMLGRRCSNII